VINWRKPIIIRGEGRGRTILRWPKSLTDLYGNTWVEGKWVGTSQYSHGTGLMNIGGWDPSGRDFSFIVNITRVSGGCRCGVRCDGVLACLREATIWVLRHYCRGCVYPQPFAAGARVWC
jgi:hypothetical protein